MAVMAFGSTNLQSVLAYLKAGHPVLPNMQAPKAIPQPNLQAGQAVPQFAAQPVVPAVATAQRAGQSLQGTMPSGPPPSVGIIPKIR